MRRVRIEPEHGPASPGEEVVLPDSGAHHLRDVLRMSVGETIEIFDGEGRAWIGELTEVGERVVARTTKAVDRATESNLDVIIFQAIPKGDRWEWFLEKATELGVSRIVPLETSRTVVSVPDKKLDRKMARWRRILDNAARQSERTRVPDLEEPQTLAESLLGTLPELSFFAHPNTKDKSSSASPESVAIWIGPEGGFTEEEVARLRDVGVRPMRFGPRILRSETAGVVAAAAAQLRWGDLK